jgi:hypothetical protein
MKNQVVGVSTWSGGLHLRFIVNREPYTSKQLGFDLENENRFCGGCTDFDFSKDFLSSETGIVKLISCYGNGLVKLWALGTLFFSFLIQLNSKISQNLQKTNLILKSNLKASD